MAAITEAGNYPTRTVHLSDRPEHVQTHVVVEVYYGDQWHLYDPTFGVSFLDKQGAVASYKQIRLDPSLVTPETFRGMAAETVRGIMEWMPKAFGSGLHQVYYATKDEASAAW